MKEEYQKPQMVVVEISQEESMLYASGPQTRDYDDWDGEWD